jgi:allantoate deiminase
MSLNSVAEEVVGRCRLLAKFTEEPGFTTRMSFSEPMRAVHDTLRGWMERAGMSVEVDQADNLRGIRRSERQGAPRLFIGSHLDTVPRAGAFDGVLGVVLGVALIELLNGRHLPFDVEVIGFADEEGARTGVPFLGSLAFIGAEQAFGQHSYLEFHIEQGPVLDNLGLPLGIVETIAGQSRLDVRFDGAANHAGVTPMSVRRDALAGAAEWISAVEREARAAEGAVATVGRLQASPGAGNVIPGTAECSLDVRHSSDSVRRALVTRLLRCAEQIAARRRLAASWNERLDQEAVAMDEALVGLLERGVESAGFPVYRMASGAGHDAMIVARRMPAAMLFLRSPGGISHHPDETVLAGDVAAALAAGLKLLEELELCAPC